MKSYSMSSIELLSKERSYTKFKTEGGRKMNKRGGLMDLPVNLLLLFIVVTFLIALMPGFVEVIDMGQNSGNLNCVGYVYNGNVNHSLSYNATIGTKSSIACLAIKLYIPYIVLGVLIAGVALIIYGRGGGAEPSAYG